MNEFHGGRAPRPLERETERGGATRGLPGGRVYWRAASLCLSLSLARAERRGECGPGIQRAQGAAHSIPTPRCSSAERNESSSERISGADDDTAAGDARGAFLAMGWFGGSVVAGGYTEEIFCPLIFRGCKVFRGFEVIRVVTRSEVVHCINMIDEHIYFEK